jgi:hypothetical protein
LPKQNFAVNISKTYIPDRDNTTGEQKGLTITDYLRNFKAEKFGFGIGE